jgi:hypothetical protein
MGAVAGLVIFAVILTKTPVDMSVPNEIFGQWSGSGILESDETLVNINMEIGKNYIVSGNIGDVIFEDAVLKKRSEPAEPSGFVIENVILDRNLDEEDNDISLMVNIFLYLSDHEIKGFIEQVGLFVYPKVIIEDILIVRQE